ncbi:MAG: hypothetical protein Q8K98_01435 [Bacteroidota bacterium]|nr:hypothetical protein [Bacteroidota bacterium]
MVYIQRIINTLILILIFFQCGKINAQNLELKLDIDTNTFLEAQSIWANVVLKNNGKDTAILQPFIMTEEHNGMKFILKDENQTKLNYSWEITSDDFEMSPNKKISSGDSLWEIYNINTFFNNSEYKNAVIYMYTLHYLIAGNYSLQAYAVNKKDTIFSNKVEFKVIKPEGPELKALRTLRSIELERHTVSDEITINKYEKFFNNFPNSIYTPQAFDRPFFLLWYKQPDKERAKILLLKLINSFPNIGHSVKKLGTLLYHFTDVEKENFLNMIIHKHPNTKVAKLSERLLKSMK